MNNGILGGGAGVAEKKGFRTVRTEYITSPDYDPKYFETFPTCWAAAYAFRKTLDLPVTVYFRGRWWALYRRSVASC